VGGAVHSEVKLCCSAAVSEVTKGGLRENLCKEVVSLAAGISLSMVDIPYGGENSACEPPSCTCLGIGTCRQTSRPGEFRLAAVSRMSLMARRYGTKRFLDLKKESKLGA